MLRQRAKLLRAGRFDPSWLGGLERQAAAAGVAIAAARRHTVRRAGGGADRSAGRFPTLDLALAGQIEDWLAELPALEVEERFAEALAQSRRQDAETGITAIGPHRSDLVVHDGASGRLPATARPGSRRRCS